MCEKCQDRGFIEENHGLLIIACDCEAGKEYKAQMRELLGIPKEENWEIKFEDEDGNSGVGQPDTDAGGDNPSEPRKPRKRKARRKTAKKSG